MRLLISHIYALQTVDVPDGHELDEVDEDEDIDEDDGLVIFFVSLFLHQQTILLWKAGFSDMCFPSLDGFHLRIMMRKMTMMKIMIMKMLLVVVCLMLTRASWMKLYCSSV